MTSTLLWKRGRSPLVAVAALCVLLSAAFLLAPAADHRDGPIFINTQANGQADINDAYIFRSPGNANYTVLAITFQPFPGVLTPVTTDPTLTYDFHIDISNPLDFIEEITFRVTYGAPDTNGVQSVMLRGLPAARFPPNGILARGFTGQNIPFKIKGLPAMFRSAIQDDPFLLDAGALNAALNSGDLSKFPRNPGKNFFGPNVNTFAIVIEVPSSVLGANNALIAAWASTSKNGVQLDRTGRPGINTVLIPPLPRKNLVRGDRRNAFNAGLPRNDIRDFKADMVSVLSDPNFYWQATTHRTAMQIDGLANALLPDVLVFQLGNSQGFGNFVGPMGNQYLGNGRKLSDNVIDTELTVLTNGAVTSENVQDDNGLRITDGSVDPVSGKTRPIAFPYIGAADLPLNGPGSGPNP